MTIAALSMSPATASGSVPAAPDQPATAFADILAALGGMTRGGQPAEPSVRLREAPIEVDVADTCDAHTEGDPRAAPVERDEPSQSTPVLSDHPIEGRGPVEAGSAPEARVQHYEPTASKPVQAPSPTRLSAAVEERTSFQARCGIQSAMRDAPPTWTPGLTRGDEGEVRHLPVRAAVFNERGLLRDVVPSTSTAVAATDDARPTPSTGEAATLPYPSYRARPDIHVSTPLPAAAPARPWTPGQARGDEGRETSVEVDRPAPLACEVVPQSPLIAAPPFASTAGVRQAGIASAPLRAAKSAAPIIALLRAVRPAPERTEGPASRARILPDREPRPDDTAQAQLHLTPTADGVHILAAVTRADRDERVRLRDRIAGLLSRHGFALADLRLGGAALPATKDR